MVTRFKILGPVEFEGGDGPVVVRGAKRRALLVRLLVSANQSVPVERLANDLWDGAPPAGAGSTLASHVSLLRGILGGNRVASQAGGYRLTVHSGELDVADFESELTLGRRALRNDDPQRAVRLFERGLAHWRGPALADVDGAAWVQGEIARLDELRLGAEEVLLDTRLALGQHREVTAAAEAAVTDQPLREQRWAALMLALYRSGRQADALRAYQRLRSLLDDQLGIEPSPELASLEEAIILQHPELTWSPSPSSPNGTVPAAVTSGAATLMVADWAPAGASQWDRTPLLRDAVIEHGGREISSLGQHLMAVFARPSGALAAATAMQRGIREQNQRSPEALELRIGLSAGELDLEDGECGGDAVHAAEVLCSRAAGGQVLATTLVRDMAGRRGQFAFVDHGPLVAPGLFEPLATLLLEWEPTPDGEVAIPLPEAMLVGSPGFFGRSSEQSQLAEQFGLAAQGKRQMVFVAGEPGIGKTALTATVARSVHESGGTVLYGRCLEYVSAPYQPFLEMLSHYLQFAPLSELDTHVSEFGGELVRLIPTLSHRVPTVPAPSTSDPDTERYLAFRATVGLLAGAARDRPVLLVLDDLHWADPATLQLLRHLAATTEHLPLLVFGTFRSSEVTPEHPLADALAALWRESGVARIELHGLSAAEVLDLCVSLADQEVGTDEESMAAFVDALQRDTGGNPFFVRELVRHLVESGGLVRDENRGWTASEQLLRSGLPPSLREVVGQRIRRLGAKVERLLSLASVIGPEFDPDTLAHVADMTDDAVLDLLEVAEQSALLHPSTDDNGFVFAHALIRHTLYDALRPARRRQLHARVAAALESTVNEPTASSLLAYHFSAAGDKGAALHHAERAGQDALAAMAPGEAVRWFGEARSLLEVVSISQIDAGDEAARRCDLTRQLGVAQRLAGDPSYRETLLEAAALADTLGDGRRMSVAALANTRGFYSSAGETDDERLAALRRSLERLGDSDAYLRARLMATLCSEMVFGTTLSERIDLARQAKDAARAVGDPVTVVEANNMVIEALRHPSVLGERLEDTELALRLAEELGDPAALFWAVSHRMRTALEAGLVGESAQLFTRMSAISDELGQPVMRWMTIFSSAQWSFLRGQSAIGEQQAEEALGLGTTLGQPDAFNYYATQISHARWQQGRLVEIIEMIEDGLRDNPGIPAYHGALARAYCQAGRGAEARHVLDRAAARQFGDLPEDLLWSYGMVTFAEAAIQLDHEQAAASLYDQMLPFAGQFSFLGTTCEGPMAHYLGGLATVLGRLDEAEEHLDSAARLGAEAGSPFYGSRALIEQGRLEERKGNRAAAHRRLTTGRRLAGAWGFDAEVRRADSLLAALG